MGRPRETGLAADERVTVRLQPDLLAIVDAHRGGRSKAGYIRDLIRAVPRSPDEHATPRSLAGPLRPPRSQGAVDLSGPHRHRRDQLIRTERHGTLPVRIYSCTGCEEELR